MESSKAAAAQPEASAAASSSAADASSSSASSGAAATTSSEVGAGSSSSAAAARSGALLIAGNVSHSMAGRGSATSNWDKVPDCILYRFHIMAALKDVPITKVFAGPLSTHYAALSSDGTLYLFGRNERGQLGTGNATNVYRPKAVKGVPGPIVTAAMGKSHTLVVNAAGEVYAAGEGKQGQLGIGRVVDTSDRFTLCKGLPSGDPVLGVSAGSDFSMAYTASGKLFACGSSEYGQLGNGTTGERLEKASKVTFDAEATWFQVPGLATDRVTAVACGANHTVALTAQGSVLSWGCGGYGRLGQNSPKDELSPKRIAIFEQERMRVKAIAAGTTSSFFVTRTADMLMFAGKAKAGAGGEATMYPKPLHDLAGWKVDHVSAGNSTAIVSPAEGGLITWGPSPTTGELGYGEQDVRSSTKPKLVDYLTGTRVIGVAGGLAVTLIVLDTAGAGPEGDLARKLVADGKTLPLLEQAEPVGGASSAAAAGAGAPKRKGGAAAAGGGKKSKA